MRSKKKFSQKPKWNQNKKEQFISKADIKKANELIRKLQSPYVKDKPLLRLWQINYIANYQHSLKTNVFSFAA